MKTTCHKCKKELEYKNINELNNAFKKPHFLCGKCFITNTYQNLFSSLEKLSITQNDIIKIQDVKNMEIIIYNNSYWISKIDWNKIIIILVKQTHNETKLSKQIERRKMILQKIQELKLDYSNANEKLLVTAYIKYGNPHFDDVIMSLKNNQTKKNKRMYRLIKYLNKKKIDYDLRVPSFQKFIKFGSSVISLEDVLINSRFEIFLINNTQYSKYIKTYDEATARDIALSEYIENGGNDMIANKYIEKKASIKFE